MQQDEESNSYKTYKWKYVFWMNFKVNIYVAIFIFLLILLLNNYISRKVLFYEISKGYHTIEIIKLLSSSDMPRNAALSQSEQKPVATPASELDLIFENMPKSKLVYSIPLRMTRGNTESIELVFNTTKDFSELQRYISKDGAGHVAGVPLSNVMEATITAIDMDVKPSMTIRQAISFQRDNIFSWLVVPNKEGTKTVNISLSIVIPESNGEKGLNALVETVKKDVTVVATLSDQIADIWRNFLNFMSSLQGLFIALIGSSGLATLVRWMRRKWR